MTSEAPRTPLEALEQHLLALKEQGVTELHVSAETLRELSRPPDRPPAPPASTPPNPGAAPPARSAAAAPTDQKAAREAMNEIAARIAVCEKCRLCKTRKNTVPGQGNFAPEIMFIGEGPGADEDEQGLAFVGRAGQLLTKIIEAMGFTRNEVFIGNIVKCRPPDNRVPLPDEMAACIPYLHEQIALLKPKVIVCLGGTATKGLFGEDIGGITKARGCWMQYQGIDTMPTYHPAYLLRSPSGKADVWADMKAVLARLGREVPVKKQESPR